MCLLSPTGNFAQVERKEFGCGLGFADLRVPEQQHCLMLPLLKSSPWMQCGSAVHSVQCMNRKGVQDCPAQKFEHLVTSLFLEWFIVITV